MSRINHLRLQRLGQTRLGLVVGCLAALLTLIAPAIARAASSTICITADVLTDDSGGVAGGTMEDYWPNANSVTDTTGYWLQGGCRVSAST